MTKRDPLKIGDPVTIISTGRHMIVTQLAGTNGVLAESPPGSKDYTVAWVTDRDLKRGHASPKSSKADQ